MKIVMAFGTFDIFHPGHANYLEQAGKLGDYLIVVIARDKTVKMVKGRRPKNNEQKRKRIVKNSQLADKIILGNLKNRHKVLKKYRPNVIALGYDQKINLKELRKKLKDLKIKAKIARLKAFHPEKYKSSKLK
jgi:FAD synthetase